LILVEILRGNWGRYFGEHMKKLINYSKTVLLIFILIFISLFLINTAYAGWNPFKKDCLDALESAAKKLKKCQLKKVLPSDCSEEDDAFNNAKLQCKKEGFKDRERMEAAISLGRNKVKGDTRSSIYSKVHSSLYNRLYRINEKDENYLIFSKKCKKVTNHTFWQQHSKIYLDDTLIAIFYPLVGSCFDIEEFESNFPILTSEQTVELGNGKYTRSSSASNIFDHRYRIDKVRIFTYLNYEDASKKFNELKAKKEEQK